MRLKQLRKNAKLTLEDLSNIVGVSFQTISNWEKGFTEPDIQSIKKLASYFSVTIDYLLEQDNEEAYFQDIVKKLEHLDKEQLMNITKSIIKNILNNVTSLPDNTIEKTKKK